MICGSRLSRAGVIAAIAVVLLSACPAFTVAADHAVDAAKLRRYEQYALTHQGKVNRGRRLFLDEQRTQCVTCHKVNGRGHDVGPNLSRIGGKFDRPHLIESLLEPSRQIVEGYRTTVIVTTDGRVVTGVISRQDESHVTLFDNEGKPHMVAKKDIDIIQNNPLGRAGRKKVEKKSRRGVDAPIIAYTIKRDRTRKS